MKILLVDDEELQLLRLENEAKKVLPNDTEILKFSNPLEAHKLSKEKKIDIAFLDIEMPGLNGIQLAKELKSINPKINIIIKSLNFFPISKSYKLSTSFSAKISLHLNKIFSKLIVAVVLVT